MILEYEKKQSIYLENGCEHIVNGVIRFDHLIETKYVPTNFSAKTRYFYLRDKHIDWDRKHMEIEKQFHKEWLEELGYNTQEYIVNFTTHEIVLNRDTRSTDEKVMTYEDPEESTKI